MNKKPEALRLADWIETLQLRQPDKIMNAISTAAELRRLHEVNAELVEALNKALFHVQNSGDVGVDDWLACEGHIRAAIAKATGEQQ